MSIMEVVIARLNSKLAQQTEADLRELMSFQSLSCFVLSGDCDNAICHGAVNLFGEKETSGLYRYGDMV